MYLFFKTLVDTWEKEGSISLTVNKGKGQRMRKLMRTLSGDNATKLRGQEKAAPTTGDCKLHLRVSLPTPDTQLPVTGYDTYITTLRNLVNTRLQAMVSVM